MIIYLTPLIPLSMIWIYIPIMRGRELNKEGLPPLLDAPMRLFSKGIKRGFAPYQGERDKG